MKRSLFSLVLITAVAILPSMRAQEAVMEEIRVDGSFSHSLELPADRAIDLLTMRLREREDNRRALELQLANRSVATSLLDLTRFVPIPLSGSESRVDTFLLQNYVRPDLNPRKDNRLFDSK